MPCSPMQPGARPDSSMQPPDTSVTYSGPHATVATISGSPLWGLGEGFAAFAQERGCRLVGVHRPPTPYRVGRQLEHYETPTGRSFLRIPSYGMVADEDWLER